MSGRELVILLLGLAIVAVVLRGLYVAINARRGQIKLAIDKNIPQNVDLEALEMAELPGGGARVVTRSLEEVNRQNTALDKAEKKARSINLADDEDESHIPVLMDAVELKQAVATEARDQKQLQEREQRLAPQSQPTPTIDGEDLDDSDIHSSPQHEDAQSDPVHDMGSPYVEEPGAISEENDDDDFAHYADNTPRIGDDIDEDVEDDWEDQEHDSEAVVAEDDEGYESALAEDSDAVLFDYDESEEVADNAELDAMASVAPDYDDEADDIPGSDEIGDDGIEDWAEDSVQESVKESVKNSLDLDDSVEAIEEENADEFDDEEIDEYDQEYGDETDQDFETSHDGHLHEVAEQAVEAEAAMSQQSDEPAPFDADSEIDEFSMTAGERIGGNPPVIEPARQSSLFDDEDEASVVEKPEKPKAKKGRSLFSMFGRRSEARSEGEAEEEVQPAAQDAQETVERVQETRDAFADPLMDGAQEQEALQDPTEYEEPEWGELEREESEEEFSTASAVATAAEVVDELDQKRSASAAEQDAGTQQSSNQSDEFEHSEVLVINVTAKEGRVFAGDDLLHILIMSGLKFGDMNIFHKRLSKDNQGAVVFSVANMLNPGTFDLNNMDEFTTLGISFFLALPTPINNLDAFEQMLKVAQDIRDTLGGDLKDDHRNGMTAQTIEHYRQRVRDFELRRLKAVAARG